MKNLVTALFFCIALSMPCYAQQLPPVTFGSGVNVCDPSPWRLVFSDDFNGDTLDRTKWHSYGVWDGMESDNWSQARTSPGDKSIFEDSNVIVGDGICRLLVINELATWKCDTCNIDSTQTRNYTSGLIETYFTNSFNSGRFEARLKMPTFDYAHSDFYTWSGKAPGYYIDELDIAEAYGDPYFPEGILAPGDNNRKCNYSLHAFAPTSDNTNNMSNVELRQTYPNQNWEAFVSHTFFTQFDWHIYTCEWDTAVVTFYVDGGQVNTIYKYYQDACHWHWFTCHHYHSGSTCTPSAGIWKVQEGFPYDNQSSSQLRLTTDIDNGTNYSPTPLFLGEMDIDYVRVWQRHPSDDGHTVICNDTASAISGSSILCLTPGAGGLGALGGYPYAAPFASDGTWSVTGPLDILANTNPSNIIPIVPPGTSQGTITYTRSGGAGCPSVSTNFPVDIGPPLASNFNGVVAMTYSQPNHIKFNLTANAAVQPNSATSYDWIIYYGPSASSVTEYTASGQTVSTPFMTGYVYSTGYISWTLNITNACGTTTISGHKTYPKRVFMPPNIYDDSIRATPNATGLYFKANITDTDAYNAAISADEDRLFIADTADTVAINTAIEKIMMDELAPYIVFDSVAAPGVLAVTEISEGAVGNCAYIEMIVANCDTDTSSSVDVRGWIIDDNSGNFNTGGCGGGGGTAGHYRLAYDSMWGNVPIGSIIVLYNHDVNCYHLVDTFSIDTTDTGLVYWIPIGGTDSTPYGTPHVEMFALNPSDDTSCMYCADSGSTTYTTATAWLTTIGLKAEGDAIQVRCPGCSYSHWGEPSFYHGIGYGTVTSFASISPGWHSLGGPVKNITGTTPYKFVFEGDSKSDLGDPEQWSKLSVDASGHTPSTLGNVTTHFMDNVTSHTLGLPCCDTHHHHHHGDDERIAQTDSTQGGGTLPVIAKVQGIRVYPNPANTVVYFEFPAASDVTIKILDMAGRVIDRKVVSNNTMATFNVSNYTPGIYMYQVITNSKVQSGKILIGR